MKSSSARLAGLCAVLAMARAVMEDREERRGGRLHRDRDPRPGRHLYWNEDVEDARWEDVEE